MPKKGTCDGGLVLRDSLSKPRTNKGFFAPVPAPREGQGGDGLWRSNRGYITQANPGKPRERE